MSTQINPIYWERTNREPVQVIDVRTLPEDVKTAIIIAAATVAHDFRAHQFDDLPKDSTGHESLSELSAVVENMHSFMHEVHTLVPVGAKRT